MSICCIILSHTVIHTGDKEGTKGGRGGGREVRGIPLRTVPNHDKDDDVCAALGYNTKKDVQSLPRRIQWAKLCTNSIIIEA